MKGDKLVNTLMGCLGWIVFAAVIIVVGSILGGWTLSLLWKWFIVPVFGLPVLSIGKAIGVSMIVAYVVPKTILDDNKKSTEQKIAESISASIISPLLTAGIGYIVWLFVR